MCNNWRAHVWIRWNSSSFFFFFLNWNTVALQCCRASALQQSESAAHIHLPLFFGSPFHLSPYRALSREFPVLYIRISFVICFLHSINSIYMSIPSSQCIPPFPPWCPYICSLCLCLCFCLANKITYTIFLGSTYIYVNIWYLFFFEMPHLNFSVSPFDGQTGSGVTVYWYLCSVVSRDRKGFSPGQSQQFYWWEALLLDFYNYSSQHWNCFYTKSDLGL